MESFQLSLREHRIIFGVAAEEALANETTALNLERVLLISSDRGKRKISSLFEASSLPKPYMTAFTDIAPHVPIEISNKACDAASRMAADGIIAFGGGSALDTAKSVAHRLRIPIIAAPTNFSGSEVTFNFGLTEGGVKRTVIDPSVLPRSVIYDSALFGALPDTEAVCSGINAIAHAAEALYGANANPLTSAAAIAGISHMVDGLRLRAAGANTESDSLCIKGAWLCGEVLAHVGMALHHRLCHVLGGAFGLAHAQTHTVMLPYSVAFNEAYAPALAPLRNIYGHDRVSVGMQRFGAKLGAPASLKELGLSKDAIGRAAELAVTAPLVNPRPVTRGDAEKILIQAWSGVDLDE